MQTASGSIWLVRQLNVNTSAFDLKWFGQNRTVRPMPVCMQVMPLVHWIKEMNIVFSFYRQAFSSRYCRCNADEVSRFESTDTVFLVAFAVIMLNTDLHNANIKPERKMKLNDFIRNLRGRSSSYIFFAVCSIKWLVSSIFRLTLWCQLLTYGYSYRAYCARSG